MKLYEQVNRYINRIDIESDILIETRLKSTCKGIESVVKDDVNLNNSTANTTPCSSNTMAVKSVKCHNSTGILSIE